MAYSLLADGVLILHLAFVIFVILGGAWVVYRPRIAWLHVPAFLWGAGVELVGGVCPLTPLELWLRHAAGEGGYAGGFVEHYLLRLLYPEGLMRADQLTLGVLVLVVNAFWYALAWRRHTRV
jgi:hypothetical protein